MWIVALLFVAVLIALCAMCASVLLVGTALVESHDLSGLDLNQGHVETDRLQSVTHPSHWAVNASLR